MWKWALRKRINFQHRSRGSHRELLRLISPTTGRLLFSHLESRCKLHCTSYRSVQRELNFREKSRDNSMKRKKKRVRGQGDFVVRLSKESSCLDISSNFAQFELKFSPTENQLSNSRRGVWWLRQSTLLARPVHCFLSVLKHDLLALLFPFDFDSETELHNSTRAGPFRALFRLSALLTLFPRLR